MNAESPADSLRIDIPKEEVPYDNRRLEGIKYLDTGKPEWIEMKPIIDVVNEALKSGREELVRCRDHLVGAAPCLPGRRATTVVPTNALPAVLTGCP